MTKDPDFPTHTLALPLSTFLTVYAHDNSLRWCAKSFMPSSSPLKLLKCSTSSQKTTSSIEQSSTQKFMNYVHKKQCIQTEQNVTSMTTASLLVESFEQQ